MYIMLLFLTPFFLSLLVSDGACEVNSTVSEKDQRDRQWQQRRWQLKGLKDSHAQCLRTIPSLANETLIKVSYVPQEGRFHMAQVIQKGNVSQKTPRAQQVSFYRGLPPCH